jgi:hypothetical protein
MDSIYSADEQKKMDSLAKDGVLVEWLSGLCPVQSQGWIDEKHAYYFRARHDEWSINITKNEANDLDDAIIIRPNPDVWEYTEKYGEDPEAGYMPFIEVLAFIESSVNKFRAVTIA